MFDQNLDGSSVPDAANTAVIPVSFVASTGGCPRCDARQLRERLRHRGSAREAANRPAAAAATRPSHSTPPWTRCVGGAGALASGSVQIAFTDDPEAPDEQSALCAARSHYAYIPVAASADVVGFCADNQGFPPNDRALYPQTNFELTPNMVAGLITMQDSYAGSGRPPGRVSVLNPESAAARRLKPCPAMEALNSVSGLPPRADYWANVRSDNAGVTDELFNWLCTAPDESVTIAGKNDDGDRSAAQVLESTSGRTRRSKGHAPSTDQFPGLSATGDWVPTRTRRTRPRRSTRRSGRTRFRPGRPPSPS